VNRFVFDECLAMQDFARDVMGVKLNYSKLLILYTTIALGKTILKPDKDKWDNFLYMCSVFPSKTGIAVKIIFTLIKYPFLVLTTRVSGLRHRLLYGSKA